MGLAPAVPEALVGPWPCVVTTFINVDCCGAAIWSTCNQGVVTRIYEILLLGTAGCLLVFQGAEFSE
jgi:hypothetical protein